MAAGTGTRSSVNRRSVLKGAAGLGAAAALGGRRLRSAGAQEFSGKLTVWGVVSFTEAGDELLGQQMVDWGEANGVEVEYVPLPGSDYTTKVATAVEAGSVPDVVMMLGDLTLFYADQDRLVDLTDVYDGLKTLGGGMWDALLPHVQADGVIYSIPMQADVSVMYARLDLCEQVTGVREAPKTLDELEAIAIEVTEPPRQFGIGLTCGRTPDANGQMSQLILADGGTIVDETGAPNLNTDATIAALTRVERWWKAGLIPQDSPSWDDSSNNKSYQSYQSAFVFNPASIFAFLEAEDPDLLADTTQAPFPAGSAGSFPTIGTWSWSVFKDSQNIDAAKAMITAIMQPDMVQAVYEKVGGRWYPVYKDLSTAQFWADRPFFNEFPTIIETGRPIWYPAEGTPQLLTQLSAADQKFVLADMLQDIVVNGATPADAAASAQTRMEQAFAEAAGE
jgi:ABC-type glycerol-3-phosphate transport system substrate-binding protein